jgi:hypothetical protein
MPASAVSDDLGIDPGSDPDHPFVLGRPDGGLLLIPGALLQPVFDLRVRADDREWYEGSGFRLARARAGLEAHLLGVLGLTMCAEAAGGTLQLEEAAIAVDPLEGAVVLAAGLFTVPIGRQRLVDEGLRQLVLDAGSLGLLGRRQMLGGQAAVEAGRAVSVTAGAFASGVDGLYDSWRKGLLAAGRVVLHPLGKDGLDEESALARISGPRVAVGFAGAFEHVVDLVLVNAAGAASYDENTAWLGPELAVRAGGFSAAAELFYRRRWVGADSAAFAADRLPPVSGLGGYVQAGVFVLPRRLEVVARFDALDTDLLVQGWSAIPAAGVTWFARGHHVKVAVMYRSNLPVADPYPQGSDAATLPTHDVIVSLQLLL